MVLDIYNDTYDNKREFTGNKEREKIYIFMKIFVDCLIQNSKKNSKQVIEN